MSTRVPITGRMPLPRSGSAAHTLHLDMVADTGIDLIVPALAVEDAIMADAGLQMVRLHIGTQAAAHILRGERLAHGADVVLLALDREQKRLLDRARRHWPPFKEQFACRKGILWKTVSIVCR